MGKSKAPPPPDYTAAAKEQGAANLQAGQQTAALNRPDQFDANGSQTWALKPGADLKNPQPGDWQVTTALSPQQQAIKASEDALSLRSSQLAGGALDSIGNTMSTKFDTSGLPQASALSAQGLQGYTQAPGVPQNRMGLSTDGLTAFGQVGQSTEATRQAVTDAMYQRSRANLDPQTQQASSDLRSRLAAQGITEGSAAYDRASDNQARQQADAYAAARNDSVMAGGNEESRINSMNVNNANFQNSTRAQQFGERQSVADFNNRNLDTTFSQGMTSAQFGNSIRQQQFGEQQAMNQANNTLHQNAVQEALMQRELGMNEANALRTGAQISNPNFQAYGGGGQIAAAPVYQAAGDQFSAGLAATNANNAATSSALKGATSLATTGMMMFSDHRLKTDIERIGTHPTGIGVYKYNYLWGTPGKGVMADEVRQVRPDAVATHESGFDMVDYDKLDN